MNKLGPSLLIVATTIIVTFAAAGCSSLRKVSGPEFLDQAKLITWPTSIYSANYIGITTDRAYIEQSRVNFIGKGFRTVVYWTPISELPDDIAKQLKAGHPPWVPFNPPFQTATNPILEKLGISLSGHSNTIPVPDEQQ